MNKLIYCMMASLLVLTACFEDEGNYDYAETNPPQWLVDYTQPTPFVCYQDGEIVLDASSMFTWGEDSLKRSQEVTYEWVINGTKIGEGTRVVVGTDELMEKCGIEDYSGDTGTYGSFNIIEKSTGVKYMAEVIVWCYSRYSSGNWIILTDNNGKAGLSAIRDFTSIKNGVQVTEYETILDAYGDANNGDAIQGKPIGLNKAVDKHISVDGSITVITDQGAYELRSSDMELYDMIDGDQFLNGLPANFQLVARADHDGTDILQPATFLASADGALYTRVMSKNYLGGKYLSEPYYLDEKGYKVTKFGNAMFNNMIPCYDEKNRRILLASVELQQVSEESQVSVARMVALSGEPTFGAPVGNFPEGTEMLYIGLNTFYTMSGQLVFLCIYNAPGAVGTQFRHFAVYTTGLTANQNPFHFVNSELMISQHLDSSSCFLSSGNWRNIATCQTAARTIFYTIGNEVTYFLYPGTLSAPQQKKLSLPEVTSPITCLTMSYALCNQLFVGCENGDVFIYDITVYDAPKLLYKTNVGGKVFKVRQLGSQTPSSDKFND